MTQMHERQPGPFRRTVEASIKVVKDLVLTLITLAGEQFRGSEHGFRSPFNRGRSPEPPDRPRRPGP